MENVMEGLEIVGCMSSIEEGEILYGELGFARRFTGLLERVKGFERGREGRRNETLEMVRRDLEVLKALDGEWRRPELSVIACEVDGGEREQRAESG